MVDPYTTHGSQGAVRHDDPHTRGGPRGRPRPHAARDGRSGTERARRKKIEELKRQAETTPKIG